MSPEAAIGDAAPSTRPEFVPRWLPWVVFVLTPLLVFPRAMIAAGMMDGNDDKLSNLPLLLHSGRKLLQGEILWTNDLWMGMPLLGEPETATLYFPRLMLLLGSPATAYGIYVLLHFVLAQCTAYGYLRALRLSRSSAIFGAVAYAYCGFMLGHTGHTMYVVAGAWSPLFLFFLHRALHDVGRVRCNYLGAALSFAAVLFGGAVQLSAYLLLMSVLLHGALALFTRSMRPLRVWTLAVIPALLVASAQLLPSWDFARGLSVDARHDYAFATQLSWHPLLLSTLVMPITGEAETYTRAGAMVVCAAGLAIGLRVRTDPLVRAWTAVAVIAFLLMLGRHVPPLAHALHLLPLVDVLRGPVRHNFEVGTAIAVLAAFGAESLLNQPRVATKSWRAAVAVMAFGVACAVALQIARHSSIAEVEHVRLALRPDLRMTAIVCGLSAFAFLAIRYASLTPRIVPFVAAGLIAIVTYESRVAESLTSESLWREVGLQPAPRDIGLPPREHVRLLPPHIHEASIDGFPGNAVLYVEGVQHLHGYSSIAPADVSSLLDLDMHGHARHRDDLIWSPLPSLFGVTHVIMPRILCGNPTLALDRSNDSANADCRSATVTGIAIGPTPRTCRTTYGEGRQRYRIDAEIRSLGPRTKPVIMGFWSFDPHVHGSLIIVPPAELDTSFRSFGGFLHLPNNIIGGQLAIFTNDPMGADVRGLRLRSETLEVVASLGPDDGVTKVGRVDSNGLFFAFAPEHGIAQIEKPVSWPAWMDWQSLPTMRLESRARRRIGIVPEELVIDLYAGSSFDPDEAQLVTSGTALPASSTTFSDVGHDLVLGAAPSHPSLRAFTTGGGIVELSRARLLVGHMTETASVVEGAVTRGDDYFVTHETTHLRAMGNVSTFVHLPYRPMRMELVLAPDTSLTTSITMGLAPADGVFDDTNERRFTPEAMSLARRFSMTVALRADTAEASLRAYTDGGSAMVASVTARDACLDHHYEPVREIEGGLWLYRNADALPRMFTVSQLVSAPSFAVASSIVREASSFDFRHAAVIQADASTIVPPDLRSATISEARIEGQSLEATIDAPDGPTFFVVNDRFDPRWQATIDGAPTRLFRTNALVRGVFVPRGRHRVVMRYSAPLAVWAGFAFGILGIAFALWGAPSLHRRWAGRFRARIEAVATSVDAHFP